jgi:Flp pilus assembly pilin Flp
MNELVARIQTTLYVFARRAARTERGQTTAEYVGIVAFVALLAVAIMGMSGTFGDSVKGIIDAAFTKIKNQLGS